jgi:hypothetical protein
MVPTSSPLQTQSASDFVHPGVVIVYVQDRERALSLHRPEIETAIETAHASSSVHPRGTPVSVRCRRRMNDGWQTKRARGAFGVVTINRWTSSVGERCPSDLCNECAKRNRPLSIAMLLLAGKNCALWNEMMAPSPPPHAALMQIIRDQTTPRKRRLGG